MSRTSQHAISQCKLRLQTRACLEEGLVREIANNILLFTTGNSLISQENVQFQEEIVGTEMQSLDDQITQVADSIKKLKSLQKQILLRQEVLKILQSLQENKFIAWVYLT